MWNLRNKKNKVIKNRLTDIENNLVTTIREQDWDLEESGKELKKYKLVVDRWSWGWGAQHRELNQH